MRTVVKYRCYPHHSAEAKSVLYSLVLVSVMRM